MKILKPHTLDLTSSTATGSTFAEWSNGGVSYVVGDNVKITETTGYENEYECLVDHTSSTDDSPAEDSDTWLNLGASNKYKMFDDYVNTQTTVSGGDLVVEIGISDYADSLALFDVTGTEITVVCYSGTEELSSETKSVAGDDYAISSWYDYFFAGFKVYPDFSFVLPGLYLNLKLKITITPLAGEAACGHCISGRYVYLGDTQYSPKIGIDDYSVQKTNDFGETYLNQRAYAKTASVEISFDSSDLSRVSNILASVRSVPCLYQLNNDATTYDPLLIYGFYRDFSLILQNFNKSICSLEVEGMI